MTERPILFSAPMVPLVRPVRCYICAEMMHYSGQPAHEPEVRVTVYAGDEEYVIYLHSRCWDARMKTQTP